MHPPIQQVKRYQYLLLALILLLSTAVLVDHFYSFLLGLPDPIPGR